MTDKKFKRINKREWTNDAGYKFIYTSAIYFEWDKKWEAEWQYGKEITYGWEFETPDWKQTDIEIIINKSDKALGKVKLLWQEYVIWTNSNDKWSWNSFKIWELYYNVKEWVDKNWNKYYIVSYRTPKIDDEDESSDNETDFDI